MQDVYAQFGDDDEVAAFTAVSMLAGATVAGDASERLNMRAGAIALKLFKKNENHPGAAHYVIHAFDDPIHAPIALEAAYKYADIAPAVAHARHMPTHIFIQHGMWPEVAKWNVSAFDAGAALWKPGDRPNDQNHAADWGQYGDLQMGNAARSAWWIERAEKVLRDNPNDTRSAATLKTMRARHIIETQQWQTHDLHDELDAAELLALGMSASALGQHTLTASVADESLLRMPRRPLSLLGAARSHAALGNVNSAARHYAELAKVLAGSDHSALAEAQSFIADAR